MGQEGEHGKSHRKGRGVAHRSGEAVVASYRAKGLPPEMDKELTKIVTSAARKCGLEKLPPLEP